MIEAQNLRERGDWVRLIELGLQDYWPLPDWVTYHNTAESMNCPPWEMFEPVVFLTDADGNVLTDEYGDPLWTGERQPPRSWWRETKMLLESARNEARERLNRKT